MKTTIAITTFLAVGAGATGVAAALPSPFAGSDTLFDVTTQAITNTGLTGTYIGGGSGNGQSAMSGGTQHIAPMSRMMNSGAGVCPTTNVNTAGMANASAMVIALDAVSVLASNTSGGAAACNGTADNTATGLVYSGGVNAVTSWKDALALIYGGKDNATGTVDCASAKRTALVSSWSNLFQNSCANGAAVCNDTVHGGALWHAFRRDDASGTSDVFAAVLGLSPGTSSAALNGFGTSPYCNALNWDTSSANGTTCLLGANKQWIGPGGVPDPTAADGVHRRPPPGTWGDAPDPSTSNFGADVLPTSMQDNDPIRRSCLGVSANNALRTGEEVCNIDGKLGLVLPIPASDFMTKVTIPNTTTTMSQYPTTSAAGSFIAGAAPVVFTCAPRGTKHNGECPNGDALLGLKCQVPTCTVNGVASSQCVSTKSTIAHFAARSSVSTTDGRTFNLHMYDGTAVDGSTGYVNQQIVTATTTLNLNFVGGYGRIHQVQTEASGLTACQLKDATDQIGCLVQADPCSIGYAGSGASQWGNNNPGGVVASNNTEMRVNQIAPSPTTVRLLGQAGAYPLSRKLYLSSALGFQAVTGDELTLAQYEAVAANIGPLVTSKGFVSLGAASPNGTDAPFCEDFNQQTVCAGITGALTTNDNACIHNPTGIPGETGADPVNNPVNSTVCGNGKQEVFEECDNGTANGTAGNACSVTCRNVH